jgi:hypothetical protein
MRPSTHCIDTLADSGPYSSDAPRPRGTGPLCTVFSFPRHIPRRSTSNDVRDFYQWKVELWARNGRSNLAYNHDFHGNCTDFLHAAKLRHGTDGFTSPPKEGMLRIFFCPKNPTTSTGWVLNATSRRLCRRKRPGTHCIGGWVGLRAGLDGCGKSRPPKGFDPRSVQPVASYYTDWAIPAHHQLVKKFKK